MTQNTPAPDSATEFSTTLAEIKSSLIEINSLPATVQTLQKETADLKLQLTDTRRLLASRTTPATPRQPGTVTDGCASWIASIFINHCERSGKIDTLASLPAQRDALLAFSRNTLGLTTRAALSTAEVPLPVQFGSELRELISEFGIARRRMSPYPIGMGTARPARMGTRPAFASIAMSASFDEKSPTLSFASLESHKIGGIIRLPREIDEQSIVPMGRFLARYATVEFARTEDQFAFLADGSSTYEGICGIVSTARDSNLTWRLAMGKTKPSDATIDDFRNLRTKVNKAALNGRMSAYYLDTTWETRLPSFRTSAEPDVYQRLPNGTAILDGYPIVWTDVLEPFATAPSPDKPIAVFGALSYWWFGEHGQPRIDTSDQVWFANDQIAVRFIEEIDFDFCASDATAALLTAEE